MTSHSQGSGVQPDGTSLPPPRPFGDANTLTLPRRRRHGPGQGAVVGLTAIDQSVDGVLHAEIMRVEPIALTITL